MDDDHSSPDASVVPDSRRGEHPSAELWFDDIGWKRFRDELAARMTVDQAQVIRHLSLDEVYTWRAMARFCDVEFADAWKLAWENPAHQRVGELICEVAAALLNEERYPG